MISEHPSVLKSAIDLVQKAEKEYNPPNIFVGIGELQWDKEKLQWRVIRLRDKEDERRMPYNEFVLSRGVLFKEGAALKDPSTGLEVTVLGRSNREFYISIFGKDGPLVRIDKATYLRLKIGQNVFFVKKSSATNNLGYDEFENSAKAKAALAQIDNLEVVEAQIGYDDKNQSWFVSKWKDLESQGFFSHKSLTFSFPTDYGEWASSENQSRFALEFEKKIDNTINQIKTRLKEVGIDIHDMGVNLFINLQTGQLFLLDITLLKSRKGINQPPTF